MEIWAEDHFRFYFIQIYLCISTMTLYLRSVSVLTAYPGEADELFFGFLSSGAQWEWRSKVIATEKYNQE